MMPHLGLIRLIVISAIFSEKGLQFAAVSVIPNVTVMLVNDSSYFNCSTTSETVEWLFISDEYLHPSVIYSYGTVKPFYQDRFRVEKYGNSIEKQFNLVLQSIAKEDPGRYICRDPDTRNEEGETQLIVLETEPACESNLNVGELIGPNSCEVKPDTVQLSCSVRYIGNQVPDLQWIKTDENIAINSLICSTSGNIYTCSLTMESDLRMEGSSYVCQTTQSRTRKYNCTSDVFSIIYALGEDMELTSTIDDKANCSFSSSNQSCNSSWIFDNGTINWIESHERVIEFKRPGRFICQAICLIGNNNCTFTSVTVNVTVTEEPQGYDTPTVGMIVGIVAVVVPAIVCVGIAIWVGQRTFRRRNHNRESASNRQDSLETKPLSPGNIADDQSPRTIKSETDRNREKRVRGLTILKDKLFVAFELSDIIEIFPIDINGSHSTAKVDDLWDPGSIAACTKNNCLYIMDQQKSIPIKGIFRVNPDGTVINNWETGGGDRGRLSVNSKGNVVMTVYDKDILKIYSPNGELLNEQTIDLSVTSIYHAITADKNYIICHGKDSEKSLLHRVCKINREGDVLQSFGRGKGSNIDQLSSPVYLAEKNDGSILVADHYNNRIILLSAELEFKAVLFSKQNGNVSLPEAMCVYETTKFASLFVGCNNDRQSGGYVLVLPLGSTEHPSNDYE